MGRVTHWHASTAASDQPAQHEPDLTTGHQAWLVNQFKCNVLEAVRMGVDVVLVTLHGLKTPHPVVVALRVLATPPEEHAQPQPP